jgi:hypothetical protein
MIRNFEESSRDIVKYLIKDHDYVLKEINTSMYSDYTIEIDVVFEVDGYYRYFSKDMYTTFMIQFDDRTESFKIDVFTYLGLKLSDEIKEKINNVFRLTNKKWFSCLEELKMNMDLMGI